MSCSILHLLYLVNRSSCHFLFYWLQIGGVYFGLWHEPYCRLPHAPHILYAGMLWTLLLTLVLSLYFNPTCVLDVLEFSWDLASGVDTVGRPSRRSAPPSASPLRSAARCGLPGWVFGFFTDMSQHLHGSSGFDIVALWRSPGCWGLIGGKIWWCTACKGLSLSC